MIIMQRLTRAVLLLCALAFAGEASAQSFTGYPNPGQLQIGQAGGNPAVWQSVVGPLSVSPNGTISLSLSPSPNLTGVLGMNNGGCGASLLPQAGGLLYSTAVGCAILPAPPLVNQVLMSGMGPLSTPQWSPAVWSLNYPASSLLFANGANNIQGLTPCASGVLVYSSGSVPSCSGTLPSSIILPPPGASFLGAVQSKDCSAGGQFVQKINTDGTETCATPAGGGNVSNVGTPTNLQFAQWTSATTIQGISAGYGITTALALSLSNFSTSLSANQTINQTTYADVTGLSVAQGTAGTWLVNASINIVDGGGAATVNCRLTDGTTVFDSAGVGLTAANTDRKQLPLTGILATPAANIKIQCKSTTATSNVVFNNSGDSKDSSMNAVRIQ